ncbi:MAG TPA: hypothetical protein VMV41_16510 [Cellulomonadaceae bacterium]|nr:hypothetical protein [Cellulomonadaceae bacterium]
MTTVRLLTPHDRVPAGAIGTVEAHVPGWSRVRFTEHNTVLGVRDDDMEEDVA